MKEDSFVRKHCEFLLLVTRKKTWKKLSDEVQSVLYLSLVLSMGLLDLQPECIKQWVPNGLGSDSDDHSTFVFVCDEGDESGINSDSMVHRDVLLDLLQWHVAVDEIVCDTSILWHRQHRNHVGLVQAVLVVLPA
eukprot:gene12902-14868_t